MVTSSQEVALQVIQQAIAALINWADPDHQLPSEFNSVNEHLAVTKAKKILGWEHISVGTLRLLFDRVKLPDGQGQDPQNRHYHPLVVIANENNEYPSIPYPLDEEPTQEQQKAFKKQIKDEVLFYLSENWQNLSLLTLIIDKFGSCLSFGESDVALVDMAKSTAAVAAALVNQDNAKSISLIAGDLSGIQNFIYIISSDGALKSLRARSFYLELVTEEIVQQLLAELELPRTSIIYAGGGNLYLLAAANQQTKDKVQHLKQKFNKWLNNKFQGKVFLALDYLDFQDQDVSKKEFTEHWKTVVDKLNIQKACKFNDQIHDLLAPRESYSDRCQVCHRDDTQDLDKLNQNNFEENSVLACPTCRDMFQLGEELFDVGAVVRSSEKYIDGAVATISFEFRQNSLNNCYYYHLFKGYKPIITNIGTVFLINNWLVENYKFQYFKKEVTLLLLGNYGKTINIESSERFIRAEEMAKAAKGINRVGYLRIDVDNLGQIFAKGLGDNQTLFLPKIAGLSRQMSYFFKVYVNSLAKHRYENFLKYCQNKNVELLNNAKHLTDGERKDLLFIYAGGDDLFVSGAWSEIIEFAFDVYQCFRAYTGQNPDITLSGGISIDDIKFPLYQAAKAAKKAEDAAKANGRDSLGLFAQLFKWDEWLEIKDISLVDPEIKKYLHLEKMPNLLGVLPFVKKLEEQKIGVNYSRSFVRNLLITAQIQEQALKKFEQDSKSKEALGTRYYLHLPKIAYTLARLPKNVLDDSDFRTSLKSPYNAPYFRAIATWIEFLNRS